MRFSLAQSKKDHEDARKAVRDGIGARLLELGFSRKSARLYVREDERFQEWAHFTYGGSGNFDDLIGIFDKELAALTKSCPLDRGDVFARSIYRPSHVLRSSLVAWRDWEDARENDWRQMLAWWNPIDWARPGPRRERKNNKFIDDLGNWQTNGDPDACASFSRVSWQKYVEPWRQRILNSRHAIFGELLRTTHPIMDDELVLLYYFLGQRVDAERHCRKIFARISQKSQSVAGEFEVTSPPPNQAAALSCQKASAPAVGGESEGQNTNERDRILKIISLLQLNP